MRALILTLLWLFIVPARPVVARTGEDKVSRRIRKRAQRLFRRGRRLYRKEKFQRAVEVFKRSYELLPNKNIVMNLAICYAEMESPLRAIAYLRQAERMGGTKAEDILDKREYAKLLVLRRQIAVLVIQVDHPKAVILINGEAAGSSPAEKVLYPANYRVAIQVDGETRRQRMIELKAGAEERWNVRLLGSGGGPGGSGGSPGHRWQRLSMVWALTSAAVTVVAGAALIGTGLKTQDLADEYSRTGSPDTLQKGQRYKRATNALIGVTAVAATATVVLAVFTRWRSGSTSERALRVEPLLGPGTAGLGLQGRF